jgi:AraC-like DNA-binding protein
MAELKRLIHRFKLSFADQSHLTKRFKGAPGITPGQFAAASRLGG